MAQFSYEFSGLYTFICTSHAIEIPLAQEVQVTLVQYDPTGQGVTPNFNYILQSVNSDGSIGSVSYGPQNIDGTYEGTDTSIYWYSVEPGTYYLYIGNVGTVPDNGGFNGNGYVTSKTSGTVISNPLTTCSHLF